MSFQAIFGLVRFHWAALLLGLLIGAAGGAALANASQVEYTARADVFVAVSSVPTASDIAQGATYSQGQARNFAAVASHQLVLQPVIDQLQLRTSVQELRNRVAMDVPLNTSIISISATDSSASRAARIANAIARVLSSSVNELVPQSGEKTTVTIAPLEKASPPLTPSAPNVKLLILLGGLLGVGLTLLGTAAKETFRAKVRSAQQAGALTGAPVVGTVTDRRDVHRHPMVLPARPNSLRAEQYRQVRTSLRFLQMGCEHKAFVITSSIVGEAKSTTAANLAATVAAAGTSVCLVEADLRRPTLAGMLDLEAGVGLTTVITGDAELDEVLQTWGSDGLRVLVAGELPPNPSEVLGSARAQAVLTAIRDRFEVTIIDCPPLLPVTDAAILARLFGGALMVVSGHNVEVRELRSAVEKMALVEAPILGTIVTRSRENGRRGGYYGRYDSDPGPPELAPGPPRSDHFGERRQGELVNRSADWAMGRYPRTP